MKSQQWSEKQNHVLFYHITSVMYVLFLAENTHYNINIVKIYTQQSWSLPGCLCSLRHHFRAGSTK